MGLGDTHSEGLVQDCNISITDALEILQSCTKASIDTHQWAGSSLVQAMASCRADDNVGLSMFGSSESNYGEI